MFKLNKKTGQYENLDNHEKLKTVNAIVQNYLQGYAQPENELIKNDYKNLEETIIIAIELLYSIK